MRFFSSAEYKDRLLGWEENHNSLSQNEDCFGRIRRILVTVDKQSWEDAVCGSQALHGHKNKNSVLEKTSTAGVDGKKVGTGPLHVPGILNHWVIRVKSCRNDFQFCKDHPGTRVGRPKKRLVAEGRWMTKWFCYQMSFNRRRNLKCITIKKIKRKQLTGKAITRSGERIREARSQKKHIFARRAINHWNELPTITDFFVSWGLLSRVGASLEKLLEPKRNYRGHYHHKRMQSSGLCCGGGQLEPPGLWTCESCSLFAFCKDSASLTHTVLRDLINCLLTAAERRCSHILAAVHVLAGLLLSASDLSPLPALGGFCFKSLALTHFKAMLISAVLLHHHFHPLLILQPLTILVPILICCLSLGSFAPQQLLTAHEETTHAWELAPKLTS